MCHCGTVHYQLGAAGSCWEPLFCVSGKFTKLLSFSSGLYIVMQLVQVCGYSVYSGVYLPHLGIKFNLVTNMGHSVVIKC